MHGASLPSSGSQRAWFPVRQRYYEGATISHLRISGRLICSLPLPARPSCFVSAVALREGWRSPPGPGLGCRLPVFPAGACGRQWDLSGLQTIHPVPLLRSSTPVDRCTLTVAATSVLPPLPIQRRLRRRLISGLTHAASAPALLRFTLRVAARAQGWLPAGG